mgnify:FL=1|jgi:hypothetical protein
MVEGAGCGRIWWWQVSHRLWLAGLCLLATPASFSSLPGCPTAWPERRVLATPEPASWRADKVLQRSAVKSWGGARMKQWWHGRSLRLRGGGVPKFYGWLSERYPLINHDILLDPDMPEVQTTASRYKSE